ncbi:MAG: VOC family protein [Pseudomonadota bacterium]
MSGRAIDHIGIASRDLPALAAQYEALGFTLTPLAHHQDHMGTSNRLVQFGSGTGLGVNFIELLTVDRPQTMLPHRPGFMGFGQFNHDFLAKREGMSLVIFQTRDTAADLAAWRAKGLNAYNQFNFERFATLPGGSQVTVRFELGFVTSPAIPDVLFYVCHNKAEEHFWKPQFQAHENGAEEITAISLCVPDAAKAAEFLSALFDGEISDRDGGLSIACGAHQIDVATADAVATRWAGSPPYGGVGFALRCPDRAGTETPKEQAGNAFINWV